MIKIVKIYAAVVLGVFGLGIIPANGEMMEKKMMADSTMTGALMGAGSHKASGTVSVTKGEMGHSMLVFTDFEIDRVPDGRVYLAKGGDYIAGVELGILRKFSGKKVEFKIPTDVNPADYDSVVVWCKKFDVEIGRTSFKKDTIE